MKSKKFLFKYLYIYIVVVLVQSYSNVQIILFY